MREKCLKVNPIVINDSIPRSRRGEIILLFNINLIKKSLSLSFVVQWISGVISAGFALIFVLSSPTAHWLIMPMIKCMLANFPCVCLVHNGVRYEHQRIWGSKASETGSARVTSCPSGVCVKWICQGLCPLLHYEQDKWDEDGVHVISVLMQTSSVWTIVFI